MFVVTAQLVNDQEEIHGLDKIQWEKNSWKHLSLIAENNTSFTVKFSARVFINVK